MPRLALALFAGLLLFVTGCTAPATPKSRTPPGNFPANPFEQPARPHPIGADPSILDRSCKTDADCTVKNVGNCCGHYPACVNVDAKVNPEAVQARCAASGMASVCGFPEINGCTCVKGQCAAGSQAVL